MMNNSKILRIFNALKKAKDKGVVEVELFDDFETSNNIRVVKHRLNKLLGNNDSVTVKDGKWYLDSNYWDMTRAQFEKLLDRQALEQVTIRNNITTIAIVGIMSVLPGTAYFVGLQVGQPDTITQCLETFQYEQINEIDE